MNYFLSKVYNKNRGISYRDSHSTSLLLSQLKGNVPIKWLCNFSSYSFIFNVYRVTAFELLVCAICVEKSILFSLFPTVTVVICQEKPYKDELVCD